MFIIIRRLGVVWLIIHLYRNHIYVNFIWNVKKVHDYDEEFNKCKRSGCPTRRRFDVNCNDNSSRDLMISAILQKYFSSSVNEYCIKLHERWSSTCVHLSRKWLVVRVHYCTLMKDARNVFVGYLTRKIYYNFFFVFVYAFPP